MKKKITQKEAEGKKGVTAQTTNSEKVYLDREILKRKGIKSPNLKKKKSIRSGIRTLIFANTEEKAKHILTILSKDSIV